MKPKSPPLIASPGPDTQDKKAPSKHSRGPVATLKIDSPPDLPITAHRDELITLIQNHQAIVVCGETGSGKSTQLPKFCIAAGLGKRRMIGHTQPRRLAARSIATRVAEEMSTTLGSLVGYKVRFSDQTSDQTLIKLMTDGILLAETQSDQKLDAYDAIIIDEAHERSLNIDFLLGYLRNLQTERPDLKIIITSATIDAERFADHFSNGSTPAPIVNVEGRGYPVETRYLPWEEVSDDESRRDLLAQHVIAGLENLSRDGGGDTLVFLPTERDIREVSHRVSGHYKRRGLIDTVDLLPLYARLPHSQQQKIFSPTGSKRRIIFSTNVAESSLTVPGIRFVIDGGTARISRYSPRSKMQRLPIESVSQASANQRAGRCGRIGPGICLRLYSLEDFESRDAYTTPEIRRTNLASVVLQMKTLRLGRIEDFPFLDPPRPEAIREGLRTLTELGAIDDRHELTEIGWKLGRMPVDPRVGRILLAAHHNGVLAEVLPIAAALEIPDPRDRPPEKQQAADEAHAPFVDPQSDFLSSLRLWKHYEHTKAEHSRSKLQRILKNQFLSPTRMREWSDVYRQLREMTTKIDGRKNTVKIGKIRYADDPKYIVSKDHYESIHCSLLAGLLSSVATLGKQNEYTGCGNLKLFLWPGSGVFASKPKWIVAAEFVETTKQFARTVAKVQPAWVESEGQHLLKAHHYEPHFSSKSGGSFCYVNRTLFGLPVVTRRRVPLAPIDPGTARDLLIEQGLVGGQLKTNAKCIRHNRDLLTSLETLAAKTRNRDLIVDEYVLERLYQERLSLDVVDRASLEKWDRELETPRWSKELQNTEQVSNWLTKPPAPQEESSIYFRPDEFVGADPPPVDASTFPDELVVGSSRLPLDYHFQPGSERDGVRLKVHQAALSQLSDDRLGWLVPGLLHRKIVHLIKSLPKRIRRNLVPATDTATKIHEELSPVDGQVAFLPTLCEALSRHAEMPVTPNDFQSDKLDPSWDFLITVVDDDGQSIAEGRNVEALARTLGTSMGESAPGRSQEASNAESEDWSRTNMQTFDIDLLPHEIVRQLGGVHVAQYVGLSVHDGTVATKLYPDASLAQRGLVLGCVRLFATCEQKELRRQIRHLPDLTQVKVKLAGAVSAASFEESLEHLLARVAFIENEPLIRSLEAFEQRRSERARRIAEATQEITGWLSQLAEGWFETRKAIESVQIGSSGGSHRMNETLDDLRDQIQWLLFDGFLSETPWEWLKHYPRYLRGMVYRIDKMQSGTAMRDTENRHTVRELWNRWLTSLDPHQRVPSTQVGSPFRWMTEELRISLFAQPLGTAVKVSPKRCEKLLG